MSEDRWPRWVYGEGQEPDYRFSFANERTFLAWIRTALALLAAAVAIDVVDLGIGDVARRALAAALLMLGLATAVLAWVRWARSERAIRRGAPLPALGYAAALTLGVVVVGIVVAVVAL